MALGGRITSPHIATSVADESIDSDAYVDGSIDTAHLAADAVDGTKLADNAVDSEHYTDASIDTAHIGNLQITTGLIAADAVTGAKIADDAIDSEHYTDGSIDTAHLAADAVDGTKIADNAIDSEHYTDNSVDAAHLFDLARGSLLIGNGSAATAELTVGSDNYVLTVDSSGDIGWEAAASGGISTTLTDGNILVGNGSNVATSVNPSGDVDIATDGTFSIASGVVVNADVNSSAAIDVSKTALTAGTNISLSTNTLNVDDAFLVNDANDTTSGTITAAGFTATGNVQVSSAPADEAVSGIVASFTAGEALSRGEVVYFKAGDSKMWKAVATASGTMPVVAMAAADISADAAGLFLLQGFIRDDGTMPAYTVGGRLYAPEAETSSENVPEQAQPDSDGDFVQDLGFAVTANILYFKPGETVVEIA